VGCGGADGVWNCGCGAGKVADDGKQDCGRVVATEREGREEDDEDFCVVFQKSKGCTVK
jgi:hypothetical protein